MTSSPSVCISTLTSIIYHSPSFENLFIFIIKKERKKENSAIEE